MNKDYSKKIMIKETRLFLEKSIIPRNILVGIVALKE